MDPTSRPGDSGEGRVNMSDDQTLRALEGRCDDDALQRDAAGADDTGDVFLRIAREELAARVGGDSIPDSRERPSLRRRPLSTAVAAFHTTPPHRLSRRLSDQQDRPPLTNAHDDQATDISRATANRLLAREKAASVHPGENGVIRARAGSTTLRPSPLSPRSIAFQEPSPDMYARRRATITDSSSMLAGRPSTSRASGLGPSRGKMYSPSPLVRSSDLQNRAGSEPPHGVEGTESTASTMAPSTVWDELDDLKSRIHRLELTGRLPSTSGAAVLRISDERPPTAMTTVTTMSSSPKRQAEAANATPPNREAQNILRSALAKSRPFMSPDVYRALESVANDAVGLSAMMGTPGQPGPISSGASTVGPGNTVTDRQLRIRADGVCRSLTELCVALGEDAAAQPRPAQPSQPTLAQMDGPTASTMPKSYSGLPAPRRASITTAEHGLPKSSGSNRAMSRFEEQRHSLLNGTAWPTPRLSGSNTSTLSEAKASRRSSLIVGRTRRVNTEEPEDGRNSCLLRSRRAGTEEPSEGRRTSLLVRSRRGTVGEENDSSHGAPSRTNTEANMVRGLDYSPESQTTPPDQNAQYAASAAVSRRRYVSTSFHSSRLAVPSGLSTVSPRHYLERPILDGDANSAGLVEESGTRHPPLSQGISHMRASSLSTKRQNRDSMVSTTSSTTTAGAFR